MEHLDTVPHDAVPEGPEAPAAMNVRQRAEKLPEILRECERNDLRPPRDLLGEGERVVVPHDAPEVPRGAGRVLEDVPKTRSEPSGPCADTVRVQAKKTRPRMAKRVIVIPPSATDPKSREASQRHESLVRVGGE